MYSIGIDIGSTYTKYCVMNTESEIVALFSEKTPIRQKEFFAAKLEVFRQKYGDFHITSCGYGRHNVSAIKNVSELTALARGACASNSRESVVLDIGGQDTKIISQEDGKLKKFFMNDRCAAGCGMFLSNTLELLQMDLRDIDLTMVTEPDITLSSVCAVFAQSEIVELIAENRDPSVIIHAVVWQILQQAKALLNKLDCTDITLSGGLTRIKGIREYAEQVLGQPVILPENAVYLSSIGCAFLGI